MIESPPKFYTRRYERTDTHFVLDLMRKSLGESASLRRTEDIWRWKHLENWFGGSHVLVATSDIVPVVGLRAFMRWRFRLDDEVYTAVRAVDTATHPDFQRRGMFSKLTSKALDDVRVDGTDIIFNTPNSKSRPGYLKLGWQPVGDVQPLVKILSHRRFAAGMLKYKLGRGGGRDGDESLRPDEFIRGQGPDSVARLFDRARELVSLILANEERWTGFIRTDTSPSFLRWRYRDHPVHRYHTVTIENQGQLQAAAIFRFNRRFGLRELVISELMLAEDDPALLDQLVQQLRDTVNADYMIGYAGERSTDASLLSGCGFRRFPIAALSLTAYPLASRVQDWTSLPKWGVGLGDLEYF